MVRRYSAHLVLLLLWLIDFSRGGSYDGWGGITLHCRDNDNKPVDWWFIYKPPGEARSVLRISSNFTYITSREADGRWLDGGMSISGNTLLQYTLEPLYRLTYRSHMAAVAYSSRERTNQTSGTMAQGLMMADLMGGLWLGHTLPGFPDMSTSWPRFPEAELLNGHVFGCVSLSRDAMDALAAAVELAAPNIDFFHMPDNRLRLLLPKWTFHEKTVLINKKAHNLQLNLSSKDGLPLAVVSRAPGHPHCPYRTFAQERGLGLDVYGHTKSGVRTSVCTNDFMVRNIEKISLKLPEKVYYVDAKKDKSRFAVTTAVHWQRRGASAEPWVCLSNLDKEDRTRPAGLLLCINHYSIWSAFDNFKISEPKCPNSQSRPKN